MKKRILAIVLSLCLVSGLLPAMAFAGSTNDNCLSGDCVVDSGIEKALEMQKTSEAVKSQKTESNSNEVVEQAEKSDLREIEKAITKKSTKATTYVAELNGYIYTTLQGAVDDAEDGDTIYLIDDVVLQGAIIRCKDITIDFQDHYIGGTYSDAMLIIQDADVELYNGSVFNLGTGDGAIITSDAAVYFESMTFATRAENTAGVITGEYCASAFYDCNFLNGSVLEEEGEFVCGVFVANDAVAELQNCNMLFDDGVGVLVGDYGEASLYDNYINFIDGRAVSVNDGGEVYIYGGNYVAYTGLYIGGGIATIGRGVFESSYENTPAIKGIYDDYGTNVNISESSIAVPAGWRNSIKGLVAVYYDMDKPANMKVGLNQKYNKIRASWNSVDGADGYSVYLKKGTGAYKWIGTTTKKYYTFSGLSAGYKYAVKVIPYCKCVGVYDDVLGEGSMLATGSTYTLKKVVLNKFTKSNGKVKVKWKNINGETGYQISKSIKKTGTNVVATYKTTKGTYKLIKATKGKNYWYKVRAYKIVNGKKIFGPWSAPKKFKR